MSTSKKKSTKKRLPPTKRATSKTTASERAHPQAAVPNLAIKTMIPRKSKRAKPEKRGALNAAAKVLSESGEPMTTRAMIERMATQGYWTSPHGQTPSATLYAVVTRVPKTS